MSYKDDDKTVFPTRTGRTAGTAIERKMLDEVGGAGGIRTRILASAEGTTILRTRNGMPHFETTNEELREQALIRIFAIECSALGGEGNMATYVGFSKDGKQRRAYAKQKWYDTYAFVNEWVGNGTLAGQRIRWCGMDQAGGYVGCFRREALTATDVPRWDYEKNLNVAWGNETTVAFAPPGTPVGWMNWGGGPMNTPQFSNEATSGYGALARFSTLQGAGLHGAFMKAVGGVPHRCTIVVTDFSALTSTTPRAVFATVNDITGNTSSTITFGTPPTAYTQFSYSGRIGRQPIVVDEAGTRGVAEVYVKMYTPATGMVSGVCMLDINLVTNVARVLLFPGDRAHYFNFGFIDGVLVSAWMRDSTPSTTGKSALVGNTVLVTVPAAPGWVPDATFMVADYVRKIFVVRVSDGGYSEDRSVYVVFYNFTVVAKLYVLVAYDGFMTYTASEIPEASASGFPAFSTPTNSTITPASPVEWVTTYSGATKTFSPQQQPTYGAAYACVDLPGKVIAVSITLNHMQAGNAGASTAVWNGPRALNKIIRVATGQIKSFGHSSKFYNRLHFQD